MNKLGITLATALFFAGTANAQVPPGDPIAGQVPSYAVEGLTLGSRAKFDSSTYREYKCAPSDQFDGHTWCQKTRRESERRGSFEATYSMLHRKDGTVVYVNRHQHPAFFDANEADRNIQNYSLKFAESPKIIKIPRRAGNADAVLATWGKIELEPLDDDSVRLLAEGKSPRKGLLIDFVGNFSRSARDGLPIYRIVGGAGFVWAGSFDQKGRGTLRFAAVDPSTLQPELVAVQPPTPTQNHNQQPSSQSQAEQPSPPRQADPPRPAQQPSPSRQAEQPSPRPAEQPSPPRPAELAAAIKARRDAEATVAQLQTELSMALHAKTDAEHARTEAEKLAQQARTDAEIARKEAEKLAQQARGDAEIARKEFEEARNDANTAMDEIDRLAAGGMPASYIKGAIFIGISAAAVLFFIIVAFVKILAWTSATTEPSIDQDDLVKELAKTLGVEDVVVPLQPETLVDARCEQPATAQQEQTQANTSGEESSISTEKEPVPISSPEDLLEISKSVVPDTPANCEGPAKNSSNGDALASLCEGDSEISQSMVPEIAKIGEAEKIKSIPENPPSKREDAATS